MSMSTIRKRDILALIAVVAILLAMIPTMVLAAGDTGDVTGTFQLGNSDPVVNSVGLFSTGGASQDTITPQQEQVIKVDVTDNDTLNNLTTITVTVWYDSTGSATRPTVVDPKTCAIFTWTKSGGTYTMPSNGTWAILTGLTPTLSATNGVFEFHFKAGKVATEETVGTTSQWRIYAEASDGTASASNSQAGRKMAWYGEVDTSAAVNWGTVTANSDFPANKQTGISVTYRANGNYTEQVAASSPWSGGATLNAGGTPGGNAFSLKAWNSDTYGSAVLVNNSPTYTALDITGTQTNEGGNPVNNNTLWLKVGTPFNTGIQSGTIYYQIVNR